jgi:hypothetical protein
MNSAQDVHRQEPSLTKEVGEWLAVVVAGVAVFGLVFTIATALLEQQR